MDARAERYHRALAETRALLWEMDPEGFAEAGAPDDEYDSYAERLVIHLLKSDPTSGEELDRWADAMFKGDSVERHAFAERLRNLRASYAL